MRQGSGRGTGASIHVEMETPKQDPPEDLLCPGTSTALR